MTKLEQAARQALGALVRAEAMYGQPNADIQTALREALAEQAEQEPVAYFHWDGKNCKDCIRSDCGGFGTTGDACSRFFAAPVRTKDLTDDEIHDIGDSLNKYLTTFFCDFARAVIAADREKNNV